MLYFSFSSICMYLAIYQAQATIIISINISKLNDYDYTHRPLGYFNIA